MNLAKILVATDFSESARRAEQRAAKLAQQLDAQLQLIHVVPEEGLLRRIFSADRIDHGQMRRCADHVLGKTSEELERTYDIDVDWEIINGSAAHSIVHAVSSYNADLLVAGVRGEHAQSHDKATFGGTALKLLVQTNIPLLLVRRAVEDRYGRIVLAISTEEPARRMLGAVQTFCESAECHLIHASQAPFAERLRKLDISKSAIDAYGREQLEAAQSLVNRLISESLYKDRWHARVLSGDPRLALLREVEKIEPDLLVVGKHDEHVPRKGDTGVGSLALHLAMRAHADLLQVP